MAEESRPAVLGYALGFANAALEVSLFGSPKEILDALRGRNLDLAALADHPDTRIDAMDVLQPAPRLTFSGGPHAETFLELIESTGEPDLGRATALLEGDPGALASGDSGASAPLLAAVSARRPEMVELLLHAGASVDGAGQFDMTPLQWAAALGAADLAGLLLDAGADAQWRSWFLVTADELAALNGHDALARTIAEGRRLPPTHISAQAVLERMRHVPLPS